MKKENCVFVMRWRWNGKLQIVEFELKIKAIKSHHSHLSIKINKLCEMKISFNSIVISGWNCNFLSGRETFTIEQIILWVESISLETIAIHTHVHFFYLTFELISMVVRFQCHHFSTLFSIQFHINIILKMRSYNSYSSKTNWREKNSLVFSLFLIYFLLNSWNW